MQGKFGRVPVLMGLALVLTACCARAPYLGIGALSSGLEGFLSAHPLSAGQVIRADEVGRTAGASYHLVQVRGSEAPHRHAAHDLTVLVLRGRGRLVLEAGTTRLGAGDVAVIPRGAPHWFSSAGEGVAVALVTFTPPLDAPDSVPIVSVDSPQDGS